MAIATALLMIYSPPLLDILPMYVLFMLMSPILMLHGRREPGWTGVLALSITLGWLLAPSSTSGACASTSSRCCSPGCRCRFRIPGASSCSAGSSSGCWAYGWGPRTPTHPVGRRCACRALDARLRARLPALGVHGLAPRDRPGAVSRRHGAEPAVRQVAPRATAPDQLFRAARAGDALRALAARAPAAHARAGTARPRLAGGVLCAPRAVVAGAGHRRRGAAGPLTGGRPGRDRRQLRADVRGGLDQRRAGSPRAPLTAVAC